MRQGRPSGERAHAHLGLPRRAGARVASIRQTARVLDYLRASFIYIVAALLPLAGLILAVVRYSQGERDESLRILLASFIGVCLYGLLLR